MPAHNQPDRAMGSALQISRRRLVTVGVALLLLVVVAGRNIAAWRMQSTAVTDLRQGVISEAQRSLESAAWLNQSDSRTDLLCAACFLHYGEQDAWNRALMSARQHGIDRDQLRMQRKLGQMRWGNDPGVSARDYSVLTEQGATPGETLVAVVFGLLSADKSHEAVELLRDAAGASQTAAQTAYLRGESQLAAGDLQAAEAEFRDALVQQPHHEMARASLARMLEEQYRLNEAYSNLAILATAAPGWENAVIGLSRVLRELGHPDRARTVMESIVSRTDVSPAVHVEQARIEFESGNYAAAQREFQRTDLAGAQRADLLRDAATVFALNGEVGEAEALFRRIDAAQGLVRRSGELQRRLALDTADRVAAEELTRLSTESVARATDNSADARVSPLYRQHCAACHNGDGDGDGRAARHLYPRPRDLRAQRMRLISTTNGIPVREDIERVIRRGMPGTSMPAFADLSADEITQLAKQVQQFRAAGIRERVQNQVPADTPLDDEELESIVARLTRPGEVIAAPEFESPGTQIVAAGRTVYTRLGCQQCHGDGTTEPPALLLFEDDGSRILPRDLIRDPMKGGADAESIHRRIRLGMPGTPHPAAVTATDADVMAVVHYCRSLAKRPAIRTTNYERATRAARSIPAPPRHQGGLPRDARGN